MSEIWSDPWGVGPVFKPIPDLQITELVDRKLIESYLDEAGEYPDRYLVTEEPGNIQTVDRYVADHLDEED